MKPALTLILIISCVLCFGQSRSQLDSLNELSKSWVCTDTQKFDSLYSEIVRSATDQQFFSQLGDATVNKAFQYRCAGKNQKAIELLKEALTFFAKENDGKGSASALHQLSGCFRGLSQLDSSTYYAEKMLRIAKSLNDSLLQATYYLNRSSISTMLAQNDSIVFFALKGLEVLGEIEHDNIRGSLNYALGNAFYQNEDYEQSVKYYAKAQKFFAPQSVNLAGIHYNLATSFTKLELYDSAFIYFDKAISVNEKFDRTYYLAYNYQGLAENYSQVGDCQKSIEYNLKSKKISEELGEKRSLASVYANLVPCYLQLNNVQSAISSAKNAIELTKENGDDDKLADAYFLLHKAYLAKGDYQEALNAHHQFYTLDSMLLNRDKQMTIASLETEYDTERKEAEIASLSQQASIQALEIKQKNQVIIIGVVVVCLILLMIFFAYKQRESKKLQMQTELEQRFLRSQLNPHFISNALVAVQSFMLKSDSESAALYLTKFSKLMREILENSRKEFILVEEEINMLKNYLDIHKLRLGSFDYTIELDEAIDPETDTIPPMFVQPFVENAVEHGIGDLKEGGKIDLKFKKEGDYISIAVNDNGKGLSPNRNLDHTSLSTTIIQERMQLFNRSLKKKIKLVVDNMLNDNNEVSGTKVELKVPFSYI